MAKKAGRPTVYEAKYHVPWAKGLAMRGATIAEIAESMNVARSTFYLWMDEHEELSDAVKQGRELTDMLVEQSLYSRAVGSKVVEKRTAVQTMTDGTTRPSRVEVVERDVPPDTAACIFWLKNRRPDIWRDKREIDMSEDLIDLKNVMVSIREAASDGANQDTNIE